MYDWSELQLVSLCIVLHDISLALKSMLDLSPIDLQRWIVIDSKKYVDLHYTGPQC